MDGGWHQIASVIRTSFDFQWGGGGGGGDDGRIVAMDPASAQQEECCCDGKRV